MRGGRHDRPPHHVLPLLYLDLACDGLAVLLLVRHSHLRALLEGVEGDAVGEPDLRAVVEGDRAVVRVHALDLAFEVGGPGGGGDERGDDDGGNDDDATEHGSLLLERVLLVEGRGSRVSLTW